LFYGILTLTLFLIISIPIVYAETEPIMISESQEMKEVIFDGKWTFFTEWKPSSWNEISYDDGTKIHLRTAHHENFIYVLVDVVSDISNDKGMDKATICFDGLNNKSDFPDENDYCFTVALGNKNGSVFQGYSHLVLKGNMAKISNPEGYIAASSISDENDRYSSVPHSSYEFRIPIDMFGRSNNYGFFLSVYDSNLEKFYNWPSDLKRENFFSLPSPKFWGDLVSPDNSIPEFKWPLATILPAIVAIILITKFNRFRHD